MPSAMPAWAERKSEMKNRLEEIAESLEESTGATWSVSDCGGGNYEFSTYSPAGENVIITLYGETLAGLAENAAEAVEAFDPDGHAAEIYYLKHEGHDYQRQYYAAAPDSLRELMEDAKAIKSMYQKLADALESAA